MNDQIEELDKIPSEKLEHFKLVIDTIDLRLDLQKGNLATLRIPYKNFPKQLQRSEIDFTIRDLSKIFGVLKLLGFERPSVPDEEINILVADKNKFKKFKDLLDSRLLYADWLIIPSGLKLNPENGDFIYSNTKGNFAPNSSQLLILTELIRKQGKILTLEDIRILIYPESRNLTITLKENIKNLVGNIKKKLGILGKGKNNNPDIFQSHIRGGYALKY